MDSAKEEVQKSTASTTSLEAGNSQLETGTGIAESKNSQAKEDSSGDVGSTTADSAVTPPPTNSSLNTDSTEGQGTKRPKEVNDPTIPNSSSDDSPKAKRLRKDDEESVSDQVDTISSCPSSQPTDKDPPSDTDAARGSTALAPEAPKVPPIKIVLQSHSSTEAESMAAVSQPHVVTTTATSGFPYIVSADSSGIPASSPLTKDKGRDEPLQKTNTESPVIGEGQPKDKREPTNSESPKTFTLSETPDQKGGEGSSNGNGGQTCVTFDERSTLDGTQSPSLLGKEKPTRVTRSSQLRMATTVQPSPATSPKTSTCSSPTQMEVNSSIGTESLSAAQEAALESSPAPKNQDPPELHPRKRKLKTKEKEKEKEKEKAEKEKETVKEPPVPPSSAVSNVSSSSSTSGEAGDGPGNQTVGPNNAADPSHPILNCVEMYLNIRKQIERRRQNLFPVQPKPPQGFKDYLMNRGTYVLSTTPNAHLAVPSNSFPPSLPPPLKDLFLEQEKERHRLRLQQVVEKEKLVLSVEQEILRVHGRAARALSNQALPFSVCTFLKDEEVYNLLTPEQEEKDRNVRSRYNGRLFLSWLQDVDDKWEKIKESMVLRHHNEAESLYAVQKMDWEWKMKEVGLCEPKATPVIDEISVPMVFVSDDFDLLPA